ncbi:MAG: 50S ribosomal protein L3 [Gemmatimonadota bacterium]|nr:MAG: 50S ribosomal protein L3 [Gemmatimonadota bacterium]
MVGLIGRKIGMTRIFNSVGNVLPVTVIEAGPCPVVQVKTQERDGYTAVQLGYVDKKVARTPKPLRGHFQKASLPPQTVLSEFRMKDVSTMSVGTKVSVDLFSPGERADVTAMTKGKGFTGVVKAYGFRGGSRGSHGGSSYKRAPGSIGQSANPSRVFKGKKLPRRIGGQRKTILNLEVVQVIPERNTIILKGAVPGPNGGIVLLKKSKIRSMERAQ